MHTYRFPVLVAAAIVAAVSTLTAQPATAQGTAPPGRQPNPSHWGVSFSATPNWKLLGKLEDLITEDGGEVDLQGSEFTIGIVRGSRRGGDWGVSFVSKPFKDGSNFVDHDEFCLATCLPTRETDVFQGVKLTGIEAHWFIRIVNIANRVQLGANIAGGIAGVKGAIVKTTDDYDVTGFNNQTRQPIITPTHTVENSDAKDELFPKFPLMKLEAEGSVIVLPSLKATISGGLSFPGAGMRIGLVYLFGAN